MDDYIYIYKEKNQFFSDIIYLFQVTEDLHQIVNDYIYIYIYI